MWVILWPANQTTVATTLTTATTTAFPPLTHNAGRLRKGGTGNGGNSPFKRVGQRGQESRGLPWQCVVAIKLSERPFGNSCRGVWFMEPEPSAGHCVHRMQRNHQQSAGRWAAPAHTQTHTSTLCRLILRNRTKESRFFLHRKHTLYDKYYWEGYTVCMAKQNGK